MKKRIITALLASIIMSTSVSALDYTAPETILKVQQALNDAGYDCGAPDGIAGSGTQAAIEAYKKDKGLEISGVIDSALCQSLGLETIKSFHDDKDGRLEGYPVDAEDIKQIYTKLENAWSSPDYPDDFEESEKYEEDTINKIAAEYNLTSDQVETIYGYVISYGLPGNATDFSLQYGELLDTTITGDILVIKARIKDSFSNKATVDQNYYNVCNIISKQGGNGFNEISYWAVMTMLDGEDRKVLSFTVPKKIIDLVAAGSIPDNKLGEYLDDLWIHDSLK